MPKAAHRVASHKRKKRILKAAKGGQGGRSKLYKTAKETVQKGLTYAYRDRKQKKRSFRRLWITRIGAKARECGISYCQFMKGLKDADIQLDHKILADIAVADGETFEKLVSVARSEKG